MGSFFGPSTGAVVEILTLADKVNDAYEVYQATQTNDALLDLSAKVAELIGIGIPVWMLDSILNKTGLDRVFDTLRKNQTYNEYLRDELAKKGIRDLTVGKLMEYGIHTATDALNESGILDPLFEQIYNHYNQARTPRRTDPLTLDLDGDGIETVAANGYSGAMFDINNDSVKVATGWVKGDDGILVWDKNHNNIADNGAELFGQNAVSANAAANEGVNYLASLDANADGKINNQDAAFADLRVWRDMNGDGTSQTGELLTLDQAGIASLSTSFTVQNTNLNNGNSQISTGTYTRTDGSTGQTGDLALQQQSIYSRFTTPVALTSQALALPGLHGMVRDAANMAMFKICLLT